jgi:hypothetical protein
MTLDGDWPPQATDGGADLPESGEWVRTVGRFRFYTGIDRWEWSDEVQKLHGYEPGRMPHPTTRTVASHWHPDDRGHVSAVLADSRRSGEAFATQHRMIATTRREHRVLVVGDRLHDEHGDVIGTQGFYVDVSPVERAYQGRITADLAEMVERRASIERAKGMLMLLYGFDEEAAFNVLRSLSQESNVKLRHVAELLATDLVTHARHDAFPRAPYDRLLVHAGRRARATPQSSPTSTAEPTAP